MEKGNVKWFNASDGKRYGFVTTEDGKEIFFHFSDARTIGVNITKRQPEFSDESRIYSNGKYYQFRDPKQGDIIYFQRTPGSKGDKASPWCYESQYNKALEKAENLPIPVNYVYRVLETMNGLSQKAGDPKVLWEGSDLEQLKRRYPLPTGHQSPSADPLLSYWGDPDNIFEISHWFERKEGEIWVPCPDPRF